MKFLSVLVVCFIALSIFSAFWYDRTPYDASLYVMDFDIKSIEPLADKFNEYVKLSANDVEICADEIREYVRLIEDFYESDVSASTAFTKAEWVRFYDAVRRGDFEYVWNEILDACKGMFERFSLGITSIGEGVVLIVNFFSLIINLLWQITNFGVNVVCAFFEFVAMVYTFLIG